MVFLAGRGAGTLCRAFPPGSDREREVFQPGQGGTEQTLRLSDLLGTIQRAQRPFPDLLGYGQGWDFPVLPLCSETREGLGCVLGAPFASHKFTSPSCQAAVSRSLLAAERRANPPQALQSSTCSQFSGQAIIFDWRKGIFLGSRNSCAPAQQQTQELGNIQHFGTAKVPNHGAASVS